MKLPKVLYVKVDGKKDEEFLNADANLESLVEDEPVLIGQYKLVQQSKWKKKVTPVL